ncbi:uncharacterized protein AMSG_00092 [Thecamonas trahens ATCC 50062]|uniref:Uncharacterized protein n=1 Tax=Thecamonas trahens ATCC 50062 TaxID=461836 RepID=A0A0L0D1G0_THETB|nr:hypothetical protein AMSG_00092 [Thecamonas trahens ATCC 50062]KNC45975.1 hypothetical protein AMSG_00092 [Thecamonas trahens ATCC 50062]|eukprot:XP_013762956.1 hypothetical protein AMSG_00092 [Thecamonas trahens ATCC 50062]
MGRYVGRAGRHQTGGRPERLGRTRVRGGWRPCSHTMLARLQTERAEAETALGIAAPLPVGTSPSPNSEAARALGLWLAADEIVWASLPSFTGFWSPTPDCYEPMCTTDELGAVAGDDAAFRAHFPIAAGVVAARAGVWGERVLGWGLASEVRADAIFGEEDGAAYARTDDGDVIVFATRE